MRSIPQTSMATSPLPEQSVIVCLHAEIMADLDDGACTLVAATESNLCDLQVVTAGQLLAKVAEQRKVLDKIEALANEYAAKVVIPQFVEHYNIELVERDVSALFEGDPELTSDFRGVAIHKQPGSFAVMVPKGQAAVLTLAVIRDLVLDLEGQVTA